MSTRRKFSSKFKTKVAIEALQEKLTKQELAQKYQLHPNQIQKWKRAFLDNADQVFESDNASNKDPEKEQQKLYEKIGQLQVEVDFLKKALS
ncbi:MAG: transposase [Bacteroidales bacterium]|nr:transposase [Bacteroidales bacterium]